MLVPLAEAVADELPEAWACVMLPLSAFVEQASPSPGSVSDWVPVQVMSAFAAGARFARHQQMMTTVDPYLTTLR